MKRRNERIKEAARRLDSYQLFEVANRLKGWMNGEYDYISMVPCMGRQWACGLCHAAFPKAARLKACPCHVLSLKHVAKEAKKILSDKELMKEYEKCAHRS